MSRNSRMESFTAHPNTGFVFWESLTSLGFLLSPSNSWNSLTPAGSWDREILDLSLIPGLCSRICGIPSAFPLHRIIPNPLWDWDSSMDICQKSGAGMRAGAKREGENSLEQWIFWGLVVFQGEMGAPGARGDKGEKVGKGFSSLILWNQNSKLEFWDWHILTFIPEPSWGLCSQIPAVFPHICTLRRKYNI